MLPSPLTEETTSSMMIEDVGLPRCVACNSTDRVSMHYDAMSCHGCKAFFRRTVFDRRRYCCSSIGRCAIFRENRNVCRACRFQKCLRGGMNPNHVREERSKRRMTDNFEYLFGGPPTIVLVQEHPITKMLIDLETAMDTGIRSELVDFRRRVEICVTTNFNCDRIMSEVDLSNHYYLSILLLSDWASNIPEFRILPQADQILLFQHNLIIFGWLHFVYRSVMGKQEIKGISLGNGSYIPCKMEESSLMEVKLQLTYGVLACKLVDMVGAPMREMDVDYEEYCILKALSLFQLDNQLSKKGQKAVATFRDDLCTALFAHIERRFPLMKPNQRDHRSVKLTLLIPTLMQIGHLESRFVQQLSIEMSAPNAMPTSQPSSVASFSLPAATVETSPSPTIDAAEEPIPTPPVAYESDELLNNRLLKFQRFLETAPE